MVYVFGQIEMQRYLLVYDADCGPCVMFKDPVEFLDFCGSLGFMPLTEADEEQRLNGVPVELKYRSFHLISLEGRTVGSSEAVPTLVSLLPSGTPFSRLMSSAPPVHWATRLIYSALSRLHDSGSCRHRRR